MPRLCADDPLDFSHKYGMQQSSKGALQGCLCSFVLSGGGNDMRRPAWLSVRWWSSRSYAGLGQWQDFTHQGVCVRALAMSGDMLFRFFEQFEKLL